MGSDGGERAEDSDAPRPLHGAALSAINRPQMASLSRTKARPEKRRLIAWCLSAPRVKNGRGRIAEGEGQTGRGARYQLSRVAGNEARNSPVRPAPLLGIPPDARQFSPNGRDCRAVLDYKAMSGLWR